MEESPASARELLSIWLLRLFSKCLLFLSAITSHPLFSVSAVATLLAVLYLPRPLLLLLLLSPVPVSSLLLLTALFRIGSTPSGPAAANNGVDALCPDPKPELNEEPAGSRQKMIFCDAFLDRGCCAGPLEVIYEDYEGEAEDVAGGGSPGWLQYPDLDGGRPGPLGFAYADSDTESDGGSAEESGADRWMTSQEEIRLRWEEEAEDMIEIELEEENLIEIDITGGR